MNRIIQLIPVIRSYNIFEEDTLVKLLLIAIFKRLNY